MEVEKTLPRAIRGITLLEATTVLAVTGVSLALLLPSWTGLAARSQVTTTANQLLTNLRYARSTAVMQQRTISLCPSDDGQRCSANPRGWQKGYLVFVDADGDRNRAPDERLLRVQNAQPPGLRLHSTTGRPAIRFRSDGATWSSNTTFSICQGSDSAGYRAVVLYGSGRARVADAPPGGRPFDCG